MNPRPVVHPVEEAPDPENGPVVDDMDDEI